MIHLLWLAGAALIIWKYKHHARRPDERGFVSAQWLHEHRRQAHTIS